MTKKQVVYKLMRTHWVTGKSIILQPDDKRVGAFKARNPEKTLWANKKDHRRRARSDWQQKKKSVTIKPIFMPATSDEKICDSIITIALTDGSSLEFTPPGVVCPNSTSNPAAAASGAIAMNSNSNLVYHYDLNSHSDVASVIQLAHGLDHKPEDVRVVTGSCGNDLNAALRELGKFTLPVPINAALTFTCPCNCDSPVSYTCSAAPKATFQALLDFASLAPKGWLSNAFTVSIVKGSQLPLVLHERHDVPMANVPADHRPADPNALYMEMRWISISDEDFE